MSARKGPRARAGNKARRSQSPGASPSKQRLPAKGVVAKARVPKRHGKGKKERAGEIVVQQAGTARPGRLKIAAPIVRLQPAKSKARFKQDSFETFFAAEIEAELTREATIFNDRVAHWRCQCCDVVIRVPRRTEVLHGDYHLVHDDVEGLLVNGEKFVPRANTPIEVVQPGRLRNPWSGKTIEGKDLGTTGN